MLSEDVMREIDLLAHKMGTNRSNLVNMILAERVEMRTPEQQINDIFSGIEQLLSASRELVPLFAPNTQREAVRSSLEYKYHPTVKYEVEQPIGTLSANFRTQSQGLLELLARFFRCLERIENRVLPVNVAYSLDDGRFERTLAYPAKRFGTAGDRTLEPEEISKAITDYVSLVDKMMKACIGGADSQTLADMYAADLDKRPVII